jgi:hypothetical protein
MHQLSVCEQAFRFVFLSQAQVAWSRLAHGTHRHLIEIHPRESGSEQRPRLFLAYLDDPVGRDQDLATSDRGAALTQAVGLRFVLR